MTDMIEKVARAICDAEPFTETGREEYWLRHKHVYAAMARAAIEAMREPTPAMRQAAMRDPRVRRDDLAPTEYEVQCIIEAAIDAALSD